MKINNRSKRIIILGLAALVYLLYTEVWAPNTVTNTDETIGVGNTNIVYTKHALCRMDCREVTKEEIHQILNEGTINFAKSDMNDKPCPTYAYEGVSSDGQFLRIVFADCENTTKVVTAIDLDKEYQCFCD